MSSAFNCCHECAERRVGCHGRCERYAAWLKLKAERSASKKSARAREADINDYVGKNKTRTKRRFGKR